MYCLFTEYEYLCLHVIYVHAHHIRVYVCRYMPIKSSAMNRGWREQRLFVSILLIVNFFIQPVLLRASERSERAKSFQYN